MNLYSALPYKDRAGNNIYPDFRNMLRVETVFYDDSLNEATKAAAVLRLLYGENIPCDYELALKEFVWFYCRGEENPKHTQISQEQLFDFEEDAPLILAAFRSEYQMDLTNADLHVHWWEFLSLFLALPDNTQMMKRMCDRAVDTSKMTGETRRYYEQRKKAAALKRQKAPAALTKTERDTHRQQHLDKLFAEAEKKLAAKEQKE